MDMWKVCSSVAEKVDKKSTNEMSYLRRHMRSSNSTFLLILPHNYSSNPNTKIGASHALDELSAPFARTFSTCNETGSGAGYRCT